MGGKEAASKESNALMEMKKSNKEERRDVRERRDLREQPGVCGGLKIPRGIVAYFVPL